MADKKLNEVPVVSDIVTIFGKRSNGEIVQIDKSNLATLLGELFTNLKLFPFMVREVINDDTDLNSVTKNGIYQLINANGENTPTGWGMLVVFANGGYGLQIVSNVSKDTVVKLRTMNENGFNDWKTVSLT